MQQTHQTKRRIGRNFLKTVAVFSMLCDHTAFLLSEDLWLYDCMRAVGRLSFVLFSFVLAQGFLTTHNVKKYIARLFFFAILSEIPFDRKSNLFGTTECPVYLFDCAACACRFRAVWRKRFDKEHLSGCRLPVGVVAADGLFLYGSIACDCFLFVPLFPRHSSRSGWRASACFRQWFGNLWVVCPSALLLLFAGETGKTAAEIFLLFFLSRAFAGLRAAPMPVISEMV